MKFSDNLSRDAIHQPLYSRRRLNFRNLGLNPVRFHNFAVGLEGSTYLDTNMVLASELPRPQFYLVEGFAIDFTPSHMSLWERASFEFFVGCCSYLIEAPLTLFRRITPKFVAIKHDDFFNNNYIPYKLSMPLSIESNQNFMVQLQWWKLPQVKNPVDVRVEICGKLYRPLS